MRLGARRLRWQLTLSHLVAIAVTLVSMIAALLLIASSWWNQANRTTYEPAQDARLVASAVGGLLVGETSVAAPELSRILALLASGALRLPSGISPQAPDMAEFHAPLDSSLDNIAYLVVVDRTGRPLGSSDPLGANFAPPERAEWTPLIDLALNN